MDRTAKNLKYLIRSTLLTILTAALFCLGQAGRVEAKVIFEDDFDNYNDWSSNPIHTTQNETWPETRGKVLNGPGSTSKKDWLSYRGGYNSNSVGNPILQLNSLNARSGKSLKSWYEGIHSAVGGGIDLWIGEPGTDALSQSKSGYDEIYIRAYFKYDPRWLGDPDISWVNGYKKLIRLYTGKSPDYSSVEPSSEWNNTATIGLCQSIYLIIYRDGNGKYRPGLNVSGDNDTTKGGLACIDAGSGACPESIAINSVMTDWFPMQWHVKLNDPGYSNGRVDLWIDNNDPNNPTWSKTGLNIRTTTDRKFNLAVFLDNLQGFTYSPLNEIYLAMDDLVVSTSFIDNNYVIGGGLTADLNNDGTVDILDLQACANHILGAQDYGKAADVNGDGSVNVQDVQAIVNIILNAG